MVDLVASERGRVERGEYGQNETTRAASRSRPGRRGGEGCFGSAYPGHNTAAPRAELRIGVAIGIRFETNIATKVIADGPFVKAGQEPSPAKTSISELTVSARTNQRRPRER